MWKQGNVSGYRYQAKVYEVGSRYGINGGRISKLTICDADKVVVYHYDRGLEFDSLPPCVLDAVKLDAVV